MDCVGLQWIVMGQVLARENARVVVTDLNLDSCQETQASLRFLFEHIKYYPSDRMVDFLIKASEMLVAPRISECYMVCYSLPWSAILYF